MSGLWLGSCAGKIVPDWYFRLLQVSQGIGCFAFSRFCAIKGSTNKREKQNPELTARPGLGKRCQKEPGAPQGQGRPEDLSFQFNTFLML